MGSSFIESLHTGNDLPELVGDTSLPLLNSVPEVTKIVRKFASDVINNAFSGKMDKAAFTKWAEERSKRLGRLFLGGFSEEAQGYRRGVWNTPDKLGHHLLMEMRIGGNLSEAVQIFFLVFAGEVIRCMNENEDNGLDAAKGRLDFLCTRATEALMGVDHNGGWLA